MKIYSITQDIDYNQIYLEVGHMFEYRAAPGKRSAGMMTGLRRKSLDWDRREWVTPIPQPRPRKRVWS
jgi:hypothetical protein